MSRHRTILAGAALAASMASAAWADTTVKILHIQNVPQFLELWQEIGTEFEQNNPGVKIEWQFLENEAFKA